MQKQNKILRLAVSGLVIPGVFAVLSHAQGSPSTPANGAALPEKQVEQKVPPAQSPETPSLPDSPGVAYEKLKSSGAGKAVFEKTSGTPSQTVSPQVLAPQTIALATPQDAPAAQSSVEQDQSQTPVGTAAAGPVPASGVAAAQPTGVAIAPAKQHRVRTIVLRVGAIIGAGVAVGSVVALTEATPSRPPGAR
jgi:cytoskeletal protein RodZ